MKTLIAVVIAFTLATPVLAEKMPSKPVCNSRVEMLEAQILMLKKELAKLSQYTVIPKPNKPVNNEKAG